MIVNSNLWFIDIVSFAVGLFVGAIIFALVVRFFDNKSGLKSQLEIAKKDLATYQQKVDHHFQVTANLMNKMTESMREIHEYMSNSAEKLCKDNSTKAEIDDLMLSGHSMLPGELSDITQKVEQPKDYDVNKN